MKDTLNGDSNTNIQFEVDAIVYQTNEIINGCKIIKKEPNGIIHAKSEYAGIQLSIQPNMSIFKEGDIVPVIVKRVRYNVNQSAASILAVPFMPAVYTPTYYKISGELTKLQIDELKSLISQIENESAKFNELNAADKKLYKFFVDLLNPISSTSSTSSTSSASSLFSNPTSSTKINIKNLLDVKSGIVFNAENKFNENILSVISETKEKKKEEEEREEKELLDSPIYIAFYSLLSHQLMNIQTIQNFLSYYPDFASVQKNKDIWKMYTMLKK